MGDFGEGLGGGGGRRGRRGGAGLAFQVRKLAFDSLLQTSVLSLTLSGLLVRTLHVFSCQ